MIASAGYDEANCILEIEFNTGRLYQYANVPLEEYQGLDGRRVAWPLLPGPHPGCV